EGARIDNGGHANDLPYTLRELLAFDLAIGQTLDWAARHPETLILVTADHETGGLVIPQGNAAMGYVEGYFYSDDHTGIPVPLFAFGAGADHFAGSYPNAELFYRLTHLLGW
ncbi:alkaline phosphatase, partial [Arthrospira platensis SPKY1]|nr:alkaline phosphatase [Arthrospira platensis SPKY1]